MPVCKGSVRPLPGAQDGPRGGAATLDPRTRPDMARPCLAGKHASSTWPFASTCGGGAGAAAIAPWHSGRGASSERRLPSRGSTAALARLTGLRVFSADYRLAPEHRFPAALQDALAAYRWSSDEQVPAEASALARDSAGGGLALSTLVRAREGFIRAHLGRTPTRPVAP